jgi:hypothetical protein
VVLDECEVVRDPADSADREPPDGDRQRRDQSGDLDLARSISRHGFSGRPCGGSPSGLVHGSSSHSALIGMARSLGPNGRVC